jgi:ribosomal protein S18 acetylase RimI-like enzyme
MDVRPARDGDVPAVQRVASAAWHAAHADIAGADVVEEFLAEYYSLARLRADVADESRLFLLADDAGDGGDDRIRTGADGSERDRVGVVGFALALPAEDDPGVYALGRIYVHPDRWGEGIGSRLLERVETEVLERGGSRLRLGVMAENARAVEFYESRGFERVEEGCDERLDVERYVYARDL